MKIHEFSLSIDEDLSFLDFGLPDVEAGWLYGLHGMSIAVLTIPAGFLIDAVGLRVRVDLGGLRLGHVVLRGRPSRTIARCVAGLESRRNKKASSPVCRTGVGSEGAALKSSHAKPATPRLLPERAGAAAN